MRTSDGSVHSYHTGAWEWEKSFSLCLCGEIVLLYVFTSCSIFSLMRASPWSKASDGNPKWLTRRAIFCIQPRCSVYSKSSSTCVLSPRAVSLRSPLAWPSAWSIPKPGFYPVQTWLYVIRTEPCGLTVHGFSIVSIYHQVSLCFRSLG